MTTMPPLARTITIKNASTVLSSYPQYPTRRSISTHELDRNKGDRERVVILGSGWAGYILSRQLNPKKFQTVVVSPRSYFVFTPLLASTAVGTLEFRTVVESVRRRRSGVEFFQGWADDVDFNSKSLMIEEWVAKRNENLRDVRAIPNDVHLVRPNGDKKGQISQVKYDKLVVAVGCYSQTFGLKGVKENALFLKDVGDARKIRKRILDCFETAALPSTSDELRKTLLNFAIVGGGPTGIEFAAELHDLCRQDLRKLYPSLKKYVRITIYDVAPKILPMFDKSLVQYASNIFHRERVLIKTEHYIEELRKGLPGLPEDEDCGGCLTLKTKQEGEVGVGMVVWSTGLMMNPFIRNALSNVHAYPKSSATLLTPTSQPSSQTWQLKRDAKSGGLLVDSRFRVQIVSSPAKSTSNTSSLQAAVNDVFAIGDVSVFSPGRLPATAQVANQQAKWLGKRLNAGDIEGRDFQFKNLGIMTYLGNMRAIMQTGSNREIKGHTAWFLWKAAYMTKAISWRNKLLIPIYWTINWLFGRDISRF